MAHDGILPNEEARLIADLREKVAKREPKRFAICQVYERCGCDRVDGDPVAWGNVARRRVVLFEEDGTLAGDHESVEAAREWYARKYECDTRIVWLTDPAANPPLMPKPAATPASG